MERDLKDTIFIIDISHYIRYIADTDNETRSCIIAKLTKSIIRANHLCFLISEIEDDAIFFFRRGPVFPLQVILKQFEAMLASLNGELNLLKYYFPEAFQSSVKLIVHYGSAGDFSNKGFSKLQGSTIVNVHSLPQRNNTTHIYALITDDYLKAQAQPIASEKGRVYELYSMDAHSYPPLTNTFSKTA